MKKELASSVWGHLAAAALTLLSAWCVGAGDAAARSEWRCPEGFTPREGLNTDFPSDGQQRAFVVIPPAHNVGRAPVWVPLTGTVESTNDNLHAPRSGENSVLADAGFMVIAPLRVCAQQDPNYRGGACNGPGRNGGIGHRGTMVARPRLKGIAGVRTPGQTHGSLRRWFAASAPTGLWTGAGSSSAVFQQAGP
jgi:poly(3-hydroxybutyrate) depolymerase